MAKDLASINYKQLNASVGDTEITVPSCRYIAVYSGTSQGGTIKRSNATSGIEIGGDRCIEISADRGCVLPSLTMTTDKILHVLWIT